MRLVWSDSSLADLRRLYRFLEPKSRRAAANALDEIRAGARQLVSHPRMGEHLDEYGEGEVRRIFISDYELRYGVNSDFIQVIRVFHMREDR